jgi:hypothetical protein
MPVKTLPIKSVKDAKDLVKILRKPPPKAKPGVVK